VPVEPLRRSAAVGVGRACAGLLLWGWGGGVRCFVEVRPSRGKLIIRNRIALYLYLAPWHHHHHHIIIHHDIMIS